MDLTALMALPGGRKALQGIQTLVSKQRNDSRGSKEVLLNPPRDLPLTNVAAATAPYSVACCFSQPEESAAFRKDVMEMGWSAAFLMHEKRMMWCVSDCKGSAQQRRCSNKQKHIHKHGKLMSMKVSEACITYCLYVPMKSFQIPKAKMELCEAALQKASMVQTRDDAEGFFEMYNSHLSQNFYHLGGVFFREVIYKWAKEISLADLMTQALQTISGIGCMQRDDSILSPSLGDNCSTDSTGKGLLSSKSNQRIEAITALGPSNANGEGDFRSHLYENPMCWSIIDKEMDGKEHLVGVWELLDNCAQHGSDARIFKRAAQLLSECWHDCVMAVVPEARVLCLPLQSAYLYYELLHQSSLFVASLSSDPVDCQNKEDMVMAMAFIRHLQSLVHEAECFGIEADLASEVARWIMFSLDRSRMLTGQTAKFQRALDVLKGHGFNVDGQHMQPQLYLDKLRGMILDLRKVYAPNPLGDEASEPLHGRTSPSHSSTPEVNTFRYIGDVVVDRSFYQNPYLCKLGDSDQHATQHRVGFTQHDAAQHLIDCLRHHVNPLKHVYQVQSCHSLAGAKDDWDLVFEDEDNKVVSDEAFEEVMKPISPRNQAANLHVQPATPFELLVQIMQNSDLPTQVALTKLLLFQRAAGPLVFPNIKLVKAECSSGRLPLTHCVQAFYFWEVSLAKEQKLCIASDTSLPRVFFLSNKGVQDAHTAIVASRVLHCDFLSQHGHRNMGQILTPVIEVGIGFLPSRDSQPLACLSFHVTGPYQQVMGFVEAVADLIILELDQRLTEHENPPTKSIKVLRWQETNAREFSDRKSMMIWGQESYVVGEIQSFLSKACQRNLQKRRESLKDVCAAHFLPHELISFAELQEMVDHCDFQTIKKSLKLQRSFLEEARAHFDGLQLKDNPDEKRERELRCNQERQLRSRLATEVRNHPMLQLFCEILAYPDATSRRLGLMWLEKTISEMMCPLLEEVILRIDSSFKAWQKNSKDRQAAKEIYITAKQDYIEKNLRVDNLWRELCHLYEADPLKQRHFVKQAAQHLLDGFPLEILDGDAGVFCKTWVESVLVELDNMTRRQPDGRAARIFVLSVMGLQSSGKSTILNLMFGTELQTSAGRCTRGVYMQLVPSERAEYDYVMLLDTEGIRSPEHFGLRSSEAHDNRIATFGLLPADASIFMVSNEDDSGLKEVLPMVLLAFKGSAMAESCGGRIKAKMVFVYRSVDTNDKKKLRGNREKLQEYLREAAEQVANIGFSSTKEGNWKGCSISTDYEDQLGSDLLQAVFTEFRVDEDEGKSDVKFMGSLKKACVPPDDTPDWAYGEQVIELREYIHKRVSEGGWTGRGLITWAEHLVTVWDCVCSADFELSFRSAIEYMAYRDLQAKLRPLRTELCQKYLDEFEALEQIVRGMSGVEESSFTLFGILEKNVEDVVRSKSKEVERILATKIYANWRAGELDTWNQFCAATREWYMRRIEDMESGILKFEKVVTNYERQIKEMIMQKMDMDDRSMMDKSQETIELEFDELFESILHMAKDSHPPISERVANNVLDRYKQHGLGKKFDLFKEPAISKGGILRRGFLSYASRLQRSSKQEELQTILQTIIDQQLRDARQYSEVIVDNVILQTVRVLENKRLSNADQEAAHIWVKQALSAKMEEIQRHWDNDHNVVEKLRSKAKPRLCRFFKARAEGMEAASLLIKELQSMFEDELAEVHSLFVVKKVAAQLGRAEWVMDWRVMRDCLDLQLLALTEKKTKQNTDMLLKYVSNGSVHFQELSSRFIGHAITTELLKQEWEALVQRLETCLKEQSSANMTVGTYLVQLSKRLTEQVDAKLASAVASSIHCDFFEDHILDNDFYQQKVPELCESVRNESRPDFEMVKEQLIERVRDRMVQREDESCRPRCDVRCPLCGITCFHSAGHAGKHDAIHQPAGLSGVHVVDSHELVAETCLDSLEVGQILRRTSEGKSRYIPYKNFGVEFPSWVNPSKNEKIATEVREYIFFNYQAELVRFHSSKKYKTKQCPADMMPSQYNHNAKCLRARLYNRLLPIFRDSGGCSEALVVLQ